MANETEQDSYESHHEAERAVRQDINEGIIFTIRNELMTQKIEAHQ